MFYFLEKEFWSNPWLVSLFLSSLVLIIFLRYVAFAALYQLLLSWGRKSMMVFLSARKIQVRREIKWAFFSSVIFTMFSALCLYAYQDGRTRIYSDIQEYPVWYLFASALAVLTLYETYYYWLHRIMHIPSIFRVVHKVHHESINPTVFTSFCFHPLEAVLQFFFFPLLIISIPLHYGVLFGILMLFTLSALVNHSGVEIFKKKLLRDHLIGATHHDLHHKEFTTNFGLYFTWWDKWMGTESKKAK